MRYQSNENTFLGGVFGTGSSVTITIVWPKKTGDVLINVTSNVCKESEVESGLFEFFTEDIVDTFTTPVHLSYIMTDGSEKQYGKFIFGGYVDNLSTKGDVYAASFL